MVLLDHYENDYGIYKHSDPRAEHPFSLMLYHWSEDTITNGPLYDRTKKFIDCEVAKYTNYNLTEFLELPTYHCEMILRICADKIKEMAPVVSNALNAMNAAEKNSRHQ